MGDLEGAHAIVSDDLSSRSAPVGSCGFAAQHFNFKVNSTLIVYKLFQVH